MRITREPYAGSDVEDDYYESPGAIFTFAENEREYKFQIEDTMPEYAVSLPGMFDGRRVAVMVHDPHAASSPAIGIPRDCGVFRAALAELERLGVKHVSFFNQPSGGYVQIPIGEVAGA